MRGHLESAYSVSWVNAITSQLLSYNVERASSLALNTASLGVVAQLQLQDFILLWYADTELHKHWARAQLSLEYSFLRHSSKDQIHPSTARTYRAGHDPSPSRGIGSNLGTGRVALRHPENLAMQGEAFCGWDSGNSTILEYLKAALKQWRTWYWNSIMSYKCPCRNNQGHVSHSWTSLSTWGCFEEMLPYASNLLCVGFDAN